MSSDSLPSSPAASSHLCRVFVADDHGVMRAALRSLLQTDATVTLIGEAADGEQAVAKITELRPDVALVDLAMPRLDGLEVTRRVAQSSPGTRVLTLTSYEEPEHARLALAAGAKGYLPKSAAATDLFVALRAVREGQPYLHPSIMSALVSELAPRGDAKRTALSERETTVLRLVAWGYGMKEIGAELNLSMKTVETYKTRGLEKIGVRSRVELVRYAVAHGWLGNEPATGKPGAQFLLPDLEAREIPTMNRAHSRPGQN